MLQSCEDFLKSVRFNGYSENDSFLSLSRKIIELGMTAESGSEEIFSLNELDVNSFQREIKGEIENFIKNTKRKQKSCKRIKSILRGDI